MKGETLELIFPPDFDDRAEYEAEQRGLLDYVKVRLGKTHTYNLCFFVPWRIEIELKLRRDAGEQCFAEPGLVVIPSITRVEIQNAVAALASVNYFDNLLPEEQQK
jgi:hypothetical protein